MKQCVCQCFWYSLQRLGPLGKRINETKSTTNELECSKLQSFSCNKRNEEDSFHAAEVSWPSAASVDFPDLMTSNEIELHERNAI